MNPRKPVIAILVVGFLVALSLSLLPSALPLRASRAPSPPAEKHNAAAVPHTAPAPPSSLAAGHPEFDVASWYASRGEEPESHGVMIETLDHNRLLAAHNPDEPFNPASLIKLSTSLVALRMKGADYRFQTRVYADGQIDKTGRLRGRLFVFGSDPTFNEAGANLIAGKLRERGIKRADEVVVSPDFCLNFNDSAERSAERLAQVLRIGNARADVMDQPAGEPLFTFESYPLRDVLLYMNAHSSNFIAERVGALVGGPAAVQRYLIDNLHLPADQVTIERASGREHNRLTARGLVEVIRALIAEANRQGLEPSDIMAVASDDRGTLHRRLDGTGLEGAVVGKTGTLTTEVDGGMASLAGIVYTKDAGPLVFAILDKGNHISEHRQMEDQLLADVVLRQATPHPIASPNPRDLLPAGELRIKDSVE